MTEPGSVLYRQHFIYFLTPNGYTHAIYQIGLWMTFCSFQKSLNPLPCTGSHPPPHPKGWRLGTEWESQKNALQALKTIPQEEFQMFRGKQHNQKKCMTSQWECAEKRQHSFGFQVLGDFILRSILYPYFVFHIYKPCITHQVARFRLLTT